MPIAHCFVKRKDIPQTLLDTMVREWGMRIGVAEKDICINLVSNFLQAGKSYEVVVNLYLPTLWAEKDILNIQQNLLEILSENLRVGKKDIFIMTSMIRPGYVVEDGQTIRW